MNKNKLFHGISTFAAPAAAILGGLILLFSPDTATALVATVLGWGFLAAGVLLAIAAVTGNQGLFAGLRAAGYLAVGLWLTKRPLSLAAAFGKLLGIGLLISAVSGYQKSNRSGGRLLYLAEGLLGLVLLVAPLTATRTVCTVLGLVLVAVGVVMLLNKLRNYNRIGPGDGVIDV